MEMGRKLCFDVPPTTLVVVATGSCEIAGGDEQGGNPHM